MTKNLTFLAAAACLIAVGCGTTQEPAASTSTGGTPAPTGKAVKIVYIPKSSGNPYFNEVQKGLEKGAKEFGYTLDVQAPASADATSQLSIIQDQVQRGVDVIALSANSPDALNEALDEARKKGILVVTIDADLTGNEDHRDIGVLPTDFSKIGPAQIELLGSQMNYEGDFAILSATTDAPNQNAWIAGMKETLKDPKYSKMKLVTTVYGDDQDQKSSTETEGLLTKYPNLKGILSPTSVGLAAAAQVVENAGVYPGGKNAKNGGLHLTGLSTPAQLKTAIDKGVISGFQLWSPADMGYLAGYLATNAKNGKIKLDANTEVDGPGGKKVKIGDNGVIFTGDLLTFDKANIDQYKF